MYFSSGSLYLIAIGVIIVSSMDYQNVRFLEQNDSRLVSTSNHNYAISSPKLKAKGWSSVSINGEKVLIITTGGEKKTNSRSELVPSDLVLIETVRDEISTGNTGYTHSSSEMGGSSGGGNFMMSTSSGEGSYSSSSSGFSTSSMRSSGSNDISVNMKDENNFSVSRSDLPFNWSRLFFNGDCVTLVYKNGEVIMETKGSMSGPELEAAEKLIADVKNMQRSQAQAFSNTMQHSVDMVSNVFNNIMGRFPKPPSYDSAVGNMFGNNFPFGSNNSPFSSSSGWPFSGAFAGRR